MRSGPEVAICGAGPAGAAAAIALLKLRPDLRGRVLLFERERHPRWKTSGGGLTGAARRALDALGVRLGEGAAGAAPFEIAEVVFRGGQGEETRKAPAGWAVARRDELDSAIARAAAEAGADLREGEGVEAVEAAAGGVARDGRRGAGAGPMPVVRTRRGRYPVRVVLGAEGVRSLVRRAMGAPPGPIARLIHVDLPARYGNRDCVERRALVYDFRYAARGLRGYVWDFPCLLEGEPAVNFGLFHMDGPTGAAGAGARLDLRAILREALRDRGLRLEALPAGARVRAWPARTFDPGGPFADARRGLLLAGDAAGIDPLAAEGIAESLEYAPLAARAIVSELEGGTARVGYGGGAASHAGRTGLEGYASSILRSPLGRKLRAHRFLARFLYGRHASFWRRFAFTDPAVSRLVLESFDGSRDLIASKRPLLAAFGAHIARRALGRVPLFG